MAEMTAAEATHIIKSARSFLGQPDDYCRIELTFTEKDQIAAILGQQAAEIDRLNELLGQRCGDCHLHIPENTDGEKWTEKECWNCKWQQWNGYVYYCALSACTNNSEWEGR